MSTKTQISNIFSKAVSRTDCPRPSSLVSKAPPQHLPRLDKYEEGHRAKYQHHHIPALVFHPNLLSCCFFWLLELRIVFWVFFWSMVWCRMVCWKSSDFPEGFCWHREGTVKIQGSKGMNKFTSTSKGRTDWELETNLNLINLMKTWIFCRFSQGHSRFAEQRPLGWGMISMGIRAAFSGWGIPNDGTLWSFSGRLVLYNLVS